MRFVNAGGTAGLLLAFAFFIGVKYGSHHLDLPNIITSILATVSAYLIILGLVNVNFKKVLGTRKEVDKKRN